MGYTYKQEDYYSIDAIEARIQEALGSDQWKELRVTSIGKNFIAGGGNIIHQNAMAFYAGLNQFFKSTVTLSGYLEEIAKSNGVIPRTYISANLTIDIKSLSGVRSYAPMDLMLEVRGYKFFNIEDITIGTDVTTVVLHEGNIIRQASTPGTPAGSLWSYTALSAPIPVRVGEKIVRRYSLLPKETFVDSITIESGSNYLVAFNRWQKIQYWYLANATDRAWVLQKDFLGRYQIEYGDGTQGREFPTTEILSIRYLLSSGSGVQAEDLSSRKFLYQDILDITAEFEVVNISDIVDGTSEINQDDVHKEIDIQQSTRNALIKDFDYKNYLESRADVLYANLQFERKADPPNIELFNTVKYAIKTNTENGKFNDADIKVNLYKDGLDTVDYLLSNSLRKKFNVKVRFSVLDGYVFSNVATVAEETIEIALSWSALGFEEKLYEARVYDIVKAVEGVDSATLDVSLEAVHVSDEITGNVNFDFINGSVINMDFFPKRHEIFLTLDEASRTARDSGEGEIWADIIAREQFNNSATGLARSTTKLKNFMAFASDTDSFRVVDMNNSSGSVSTLTVLNTIKASAWVDRYNELATVEHTGSAYKIRTYEFLTGFFDSDSFNYLQLKDSYAFTVATKEREITPPVNTVGVFGLTYFNSYLYIIWELSTGNHRLVRYRITNSTIDLADVDYNAGAGYLELTAIACRNMTITEAIFDSENVIWIATAEGIDAVRDFDDPDACYFVDDFFSTIFVGPTYSPPIDWKAISSDSIGNLYGVRLDTGKTIVTKLQQITVGGSCSPSDMTDNSLYSVNNVAFFEIGNLLRAYYYNVNTFKVYYSSYADDGDPPTERAGTVLGAFNSLLKVADVDYITKKITFVETGTNAKLWYQSEGDLIYGVFDLAILDEIEVSNL